MSAGDPPPPRGMYWTDTMGWVPIMPDTGGTFDQYMRARFTPEELARKPTPEELRCEGADAYDGKEPPTCLPMCEACCVKWCEAAP